MSLRPCPACRRHVVATVPRCVFCASALPPAAGARPELPGRFARAAVFAGATLASACGAPQPGPAGRVTEPPGDAAAGPLVAVAPPVDAGAPALPPVDAAPPVVTPDAGARLPPEPSPVAAAPVGAGEIQGVLYSSGSRVGAGGVPIRLTGPGAPQVTSTDAAGRFAFTGLAPGPWVVAYDDWWTRRSPASPTVIVVERRVRIGRSKRPVSIRLTFKGPPPAMPVRAHQAMPYGAPPARRRVV